MSRKWSQVRAAKGAPPMTEERRQELREAFRRELAAVLVVGDDMSDKVVDFVLDGVCLECGSFLNSGDGHNEGCPHTNANIEKPDLGSTRINHL